ncbi:MAG: type I-C CRISPR-associated protein Cas5c [Fermentimonas sp.]|jgi:CRISPR-associated protein Cas5d
MGYGIKLKIWGDYACFTRPEFKVERVSYDIITPSAARNILQSIYWKPAIEWVIDRIYVLKPIQFDNIRRNERAGKISVSKIKSAMNGKDTTLYQDQSSAAVQRASLVLKNVCYVIEAHFNLTSRAGPTDTEEKHYNIAFRRMKNGQCFNTPYLGCREFSAYFELIDNIDTVKDEIIPETKDLGFMLYDIDFKHNMQPCFFRANMVNGVIDVQKCLNSGVMS